MWKWCCATLWSINKVIQNSLCHTGNWLIIQISISSSRFQFLEALNTLSNNLTYLQACELWVADLRQHFVAWFYYLSLPEAETLSQRSIECVSCPASTVMRHWSSFLLCLNFLIYTSFLVFKGFSEIVWQTGTMVVPGSSIFFSMGMDIQLSSLTCSHKTEICSFFWRDHLINYGK